MPRRRPALVEPVAPRSDVPPEIAVGAVVPIWGDDLFAAHRAYAHARRRWERDEGVALARAPRSPVQGEDAEARLRRHGLDLDDVPALRRAARRRMTTAT